MLKEKFLSLQKNFVWYKYCNCNIKNIFLILIAQNRLSQDSCAVFEFLD